MRLFIAINLSEEIKETLMDTQDAMREFGVYGKDTPPENMHLTLAFIGEYSDSDYVKEVVDSIELRPFDITFNGIGVFRDLWWAGIEDSAPLNAVARRLRRALSDAGIPFDRKKFSPHITLIRRAEGNLSGTEDMSLAHNGLSMTVDHISLMRSDRGKYGMIYTEL